MATMTAGQTTELAKAKVVSHEEWLIARKEFLAREKEFTRLRDELSRQRRELPWECVDKKYVFDGPLGQQTLEQLFDGRNQLIVYHFMLGPSWSAGCPGCSFIADQFDALTIHLAHRDATLIAVSRAPMDEIAEFKKRMGWKFHWVSSFKNEFNFDYGVSFRAEDRASGKVYYNYAWGEFGSEEAPGVSIFYRDEAGNIYHTYSSFARGLDILLGTYNFLDLTPKGRDEDGLAFAMAWVRHHDKYAQDYFVDSTAGYKQPELKPAGRSCCAEKR